MITLPRLGTPHGAFSAKAEKRRQEPKQKKEHYEEDRSHRGLAVVLSDEHFSRAKCS